MMHADYSFHVCAYLLKLSLFLPPLLGRSGLIKQERERNIKNIEDQKQFNIELNPGGVMLLYFDCSIWDGLSMHSRMLEGGGKRTLGCQILSAEVRGARNIK